MRQIFSLPMVALALFMDFFKPKRSIAPISQEQAAALSNMYIDMFRPR